MKKIIYEFIWQALMFLAIYITIKWMFVHYGVPFIESAFLLLVSYTMGLLRAALEAKK